MKKPFIQLKRQWGLAEDLPLNELLAHAKSQLQKKPDDPEIIYAIADITRQLGDNPTADIFYKKAIKVTDDRTQRRAEALELRIEKKRDKTRARLLLITFIPILASLLLATISWLFLNKPEPLPKGSNPEKFAFTRWLAKQQMVEVMTTLQSQNPELTFDFSRSATAQSPMEFMQSMMQPDALENLRRQQESTNNSTGEDGSGTPAFQCTREPAIHCDAKDIPNAPGEERKEVTLLMNAYRSILDTEKDCEKLEKSIESIGQQLHWRKSERGIKADLEDLATQCFYKQKNVEKTLEHARKLQCAGDEGYINSVYWYTTAITHLSGDKATAFRSYQCFQEATAHIEKNKLYGPAYIASRHRESGALAWLYFDDLATATEELKKGRDILKKIPKKTRIILDVISEINLDLMETYVTANIDRDEFNDLLEEINSSGRLTDGYKQIKDTLASIYFIQNHDNGTALIHLNNLSKRFRLIPEYVCGWDWSGFRRGLKDSIPDDTIREKAITLVDATNCYIPQATPERIKHIDNVAKGLRVN